MNQTQKRPLTKKSWAFRIYKGNGYHKEYLHLIYWKEPGDTGYSSWKTDTSKGRFPYRSNSSMPSTKWRFATEREIHEWKSKGIKEFEYNSHPATDPNAAF